jgi:hypothetical protein
MQRTTPDHTGLAEHRFAVECDPNAPDCGVPVKVEGTEMGYTVRVLDTAGDDHVLKQYRNVDAVIVNNGREECAAGESYRIDNAVVAVGPARGGGLHAWIQRV